jgi:hypothetical protein
MSYQDFIEKNLVIIKCPFCGKLIKTDNPYTFLGCDGCLKEDKMDSLSKTTY